jgi:hypothetical protein
MILCKKALVGCHLIQLYKTKRLVAMLTKYIYIYIYIYILKILITKEPNRA